jgi:hypothetical protein
MAAYGAGAEKVLLGREMGGDEGKDIQWDTVYGNERVPPFANSRQRGRGLLVELGNLSKVKLQGSQHVASPRQRWTFVTYDGE